MPQIAKAASEHGLFLMGICHPEIYADHTLVLLGAEPHMWPLFRTSPEFTGGGIDPLDKWSKRVIRGLAANQQCLFPSDGPPYAPFIAWALQTGQFFQSPTGMLVHPKAGLMISIRGAILLPKLLALPDIAQNPCHSCKAKPCVDACPVDALSQNQAYDVPACKEFIRQDPQQCCMTVGCATRMACPVSRTFDRDPAQNNFHMRAFMEVTT